MAAFITDDSGEQLKTVAKTVAKKRKRTPRENKLPLDAHKLTGKDKKDAQLAAKFGVFIAETERGKVESVHEHQEQNGNFAAFGAENKRKLIDNGGFEGDEEYQDTSPAVKQTQESHKYNGEEENVDGGANANNSSEQEMNHGEDDPFADVGGALDGLMTLADAATPLKKFNMEHPRKRVVTATDRRKRTVVAVHNKAGKTSSLRRGKRLKLEGQKTEEDLRLEHQKAMVAFGAKLEQAVAAKYKTRRSRSLI